MAKRTTARIDPRRDRTREALLTAGRSLFAHRDVDGVSVDEIVAAAAVAKGSFYNHFDDKEGFAREIAASARREAEALVNEVNAVPLSELGRYLEISLAGVVTLAADADPAYRAVAAKALLDPSVFQRAKLKVAFTNIHATGAVHSIPLLEAAGCEVHAVPEQLAFDARFPTVKSPNPENAEAVARAVARTVEDRRPRASGRRGRTGETPHACSNSMDRRGGRRRWPALHRVRRASASTAGARLPRGAAAWGTSRSMCR